MTPEDDLDVSMQMGVIANLLKADQKEAAELVELLANLLLSSLPDRTTVKRGGWLLSKEHPVEELKITFDDVGYQITKNSHGTVAARQQKIVRGVALKTTDVSMEVCVNSIVAEVAELAKKNASMREALSKFVSGR